MGSKPIICCAVTHWTSTAHGIQRPQPKKALGAFRPLERGQLLVIKDITSRQTVGLRILGVMYWGMPLDSTIPWRASTPTAACQHAHYDKKQHQSYPASCHRSALPNQNILLFIRSTILANL